MYQILLNTDVLSNADKALVESLNLEKLTESVLVHEKIQDNAETLIKTSDDVLISVSISFVSKQAIHEMNRDYRGIDRPTDVLSFECDGLEDGFMPTNNNEFELGDIFICLDVARNNSKDLNTSIESEIRLLTVHGMLHICGYDHLTDSEAKIMESLEEKILDLWEKSGA